MSQERLLKRVQKWSHGDDGVISATDVNAYTKSVLDDMGKLLNTQRGTVLIDENYGMPDFTNSFNNLAPPELERMEKSFREQAQKFEPRFKGVTVNYQARENDHGLLRFTVAGQLSFREQSIPLAFDAILQGDGSIAIQVQE